MRYLRHITVVVTCLLFSLVACQKWTDPPAKTDPRLTNHYCNDPDAVNYNWGFPGIADSSVCYYPADMYKGTYVFKDSVFLPNNAFTYAYSYADTFLYMYPLGKTKLGVVGFCTGGDTLKFTVDRALHAILDSSVALGSAGQPFCNIVDSATGGMSPDLTDSTGKIFLVSIKVASDTGINYHRGFAKKQ